MEKSNKYCSRVYLDKYIDSIIESINQDRDTILDMLIYGNLEKAEIIMKLFVDSVPSYQVKVNKIAKKSPFDEDEEE